MRLEIEWPFHVQKGQCWRGRCQKSYVVPVCSGPRLQWRRSAEKVQLKPRKNSVVLKTKNNFKNIKVLPSKQYLTVTVVTSIFWSNQCWWSHLLRHLCRSVNCGRRWESRSVCVSCRLSAREFSHVFIYTFIKFIYFLIYTHHRKQAQRYLDELLYFPQAVSAAVRQARTQSPSSGSLPAGGAKVHGTGLQSVSWQWV